MTRILLGMARESCADLLGLDVDVIERRARQAMREIAQLAEFDVNSERGCQGRDQQKGSGQF